MWMIIVDAIFDKKSQGWVYVTTCMLLGYLVVSLNTSFHSGQPYRPEKTVQADPVRVARPQV